MKIVRDYQKILKQATRTLIPNSEQTEYLAPYFSNAQGYDLEYGQIRFADLALVSDDIAVLDQLVINCCKANAYKWEKLYNTTILEYNPIWNVDGTEIETHVLGATELQKQYGTSTSTAKASQVPDDMTTEKEVGKSETQRDAYTDKEISAAHTDSITRVRSGNIGVTKTQDMIKDERDVAKFNFIDIVMRDVINAISYPFFMED